MSVVFGAHSFTAVPVTGGRVGDYILGKTIGSGAFGKVKKGTHVPTGVQVAIKIINKDKIEQKKMDHKVRREIFNLKRFRHPHIIRLYQVMETPTDIYLVMEFVDGGELFDYIVQRGKLPETEARYFFQQIISAVSYCHSMNVVHRDLKPENLLLLLVGGTTRNAAGRVPATSMHIKIADFGLSNIIQDGEFLQTSCGSPNYAAPEVIEGKYYSGEEVDVWSCGVILYALLTGRLPFDDDYIPHLFQKIKKGKYKIPATLSASCQDLIRQMLVVDPLRRITVPEIRQHPWFTANLPAYLDRFATLLDPNVHSLQFNDELILSELQQKYNISRHQLLLELGKDESPDDDRPNPFIVAYYLIYDSGNFGEEYEKFGANAETPIAQSLAELSVSPPMNFREQIPFLDNANSGLKAVFNQTSAPRMSMASTPSSFAGPNSILNSPAPVSALSVATAPKLPVEPILRHNVDLEPLGEAGSLSNPLWYLGILSHNKPNQIMVEVYKVLKEIGFEWKPGINPYHVRCRYAAHDRYSSPSVARKNGLLLSGDDISDTTVSPRTQQYIKVAIQLFKVVPKRPIVPTVSPVRPGSSTSPVRVDDGPLSSQLSHLLDIKLVQGDAFGFFDLSCRLVAALTPKL